MPGGCQTLEKKPLHGSSHPLTRVEITSTVDFTPGALKSPQSGEKVYVHLH